MYKKKNTRSEKTIEILNKDKHDWENFIKNKEKIFNKDFVNKENISQKKLKKLIFMDTRLKRQTML